MNNYTNKAKKEGGSPQSRAIHAKMGGKKYMGEKLFHHDGKFGSLPVYKVSKKHAEKHMKNKGKA